MKREEFIQKRREEVMSIVPLVVKKKVRPKKPESKGESAVRYFLKFNNIEFETEKEFGDLHGECGGLLRFDFYIPSLKTLIEYDGEQHYKIGPVYAKTKKELLRIQHHDRLKNKWAAKNGYHLIRIPYFFLNNTHKILIGRLTEIHNKNKKWIKN